MIMKKAAKLIMIKYTGFNKSVNTEYFLAGLNVFFLLISLQNKQHLCR